jgi:uncharacterized membrane protein YtjA (UPF0391 family)
MLKWAIIFGLISLVAALFGFTNLAHGAAGVSKFLFVVSLIVFLVFLALGVFVGKKATT